MSGTDCSKCMFKRSVPGNTHIQCINPMNLLKAIVTG
jgi:hypothetical protein